MTEIEVLEAAKKIIEDNTWIKFHFAKDDDGNAVETNHSSATCFCAVGALSRAAGDDTTIYLSAIDIMNKAVNDLTRKTPTWTSQYNDHVANSKEDIYKLFDKAIELAKEAVA